MGKILSELNKNNERISCLQDVEFKVFSQWGDDGIIQYLAEKLNIKNKIFIYINSLILQINKLIK